MLRPRCPTSWGSSRWSRSVVIALKGPRKGSCTPFALICPTSRRCMRRQLPDQPVHPRAIAATLKRNGAEAALLVVLTEQHATPMSPSRAGLARGCWTSWARSRSRCARRCSCGRAVVLLSVRQPGLLPTGRHPGDRAGEDRVLAELALAGESPHRGGREAIVARVAADVSIRATGVGWPSTRCSTTARRTASGTGRQRRSRGCVGVPGCPRRLAPDPETVAHCLIGLPPSACATLACIHGTARPGTAALELWCT